MSSMTRVQLAVLLLIVAPFVLGTPALAAGAQCWDLVCMAVPPDGDAAASGFVKLFKVHGDLPHGYVGDVTVSCQGLTPRATYLVQVSTGVAGGGMDVPATKLGTAQVTFSQLPVQGIMQPSVIVSRAGDNPVTVLRSP